jgi:hypothetical protein
MQDSAAAAAAEHHGQDPAGAAAGAAEDLDQEQAPAAAAEDLSQDSAAAEDHGPDSAAAAMAEEEGPDCAAAAAVAAAAEDLDEELGAAAAADDEELDSTAAADEDAEGQGQASVSGERLTVSAAVEILRASRKAGAPGSVGWNPSLLLRWGKVAMLQLDDSEIDAGSLLLVQLLQHWAAWHKHLVDRVTDGGLTLKGALDKISRPLAMLRVLQTAAAVPEQQLAELEAAAKLTRIDLRKAAATAPWATAAAAGRKRRRSRLGAAARQQLSAAGDAEGETSNAAAAAQAPAAATAAAAGGGGTASGAKESPRARQQQQQPSAAVDSDLSDVEAANTPAAAADSAAGPQALAAAAGPATHMQQPPPPPAAAAAAAGAAGGAGAPSMTVTVLSQSLLEVYKQLHQGRHPQLDQLERFKEAMKRVHRLNPQDPKLADFRVNCTMRHGHWGGFQVTYMQQLGGAVHAHEGTVKGLVQVSPKMLLSRVGCISRLRGTG